MLVPASGPDLPLRRLAERSLFRCGQIVTTRVLDGPASHGRKLDYGKILAPRFDCVVTMDSDCVVFPGWAEWITQTLQDPSVGACGAPRIDTLKGLHPSMLAMGADLYVRTPSFEATEGKATGVAVCEWLGITQGLRLVGAEAVRGDWWSYGDDGDDEPETRPHRDHALWWHLGSGTASAWPGWAKQMYRTARGLAGSRLHRKAADLVWRRRRFIRAAMRRIQ